MNRKNATCVLTATSLKCHNKLFPTAPLYDQMGVVRDFTGIWPNYLFTLDWNKNKLLTSRMMWVCMHEGVKGDQTKVTLGLSYNVIIILMVIILLCLSGCLNIVLIA